MADYPIVTSSPDEARASYSDPYDLFNKINARAKRESAEREAKRIAEAAKKAEQAANLKNKGNNVKPPKLPSGDYKWNLPPHQWSLPVRPISVQPDMYNAEGTWGADGGGGPEQYRRGRLWWYYNSNNEYVTTELKAYKVRTGKDRRFGFQFLWNPESFQTNVVLNTEVTPSPSDRFATVAGAFPSGETISFTLRLDRTNDFACMRHLLKKNYSLALDEKSKNTAVFEEMSKYYQTSFSSEEGAADISKKIRDLMEYGTIADLEYLYVAINGPGWKSISGRETGDIGFLSATLLRVDIGPLSYVGYVNSLNVNHIGFSQDMTPIRTDVTVQLNLMASAGISSDGRASSNAPAQE